MALDTQEKRMSAMGQGLVWLAVPLPTGTVDAEERAAIAGLYSGNAFATIVAWAHVVQAAFRFMVNLSTAFRVQQSKAAAFEHQVRKTTDFEMPG